MEGESGPTNTNGHVRRKNADFRDIKRTQSRLISLQFISKCFPACRAITTNSVRENPPKIKHLERLGCSAVCSQLSASPAERHVCWMMRRKQNVPVPECCGMQQNEGARKRNLAQHRVALLQSREALPSAGRRRREGSNANGKVAERWSYLCVRCQNCSLGEV